MVGSRPPGDCVRDSAQNTANGSVTPTLSAVADVAARRAATYPLRQPIFSVDVPTAKIDGNWLRANNPTTSTENRGK